MSRIVHLNGQYLPENEAKVSVFDRGYLFADGVYEVTAVIDGKFIDFEPHMERLDRSLGELDIAWPLARERLREVHEELIERNGLARGPGLHAGDARRGGARLCLSEGRRLHIAGLHPVRPVVGRPQGRDGREGDFDSRHPLEAARHQVDCPACPVHGQTKCGRGRRLRGLDV
jgi:hypothetical protein